jgi:deoxycytidine triphosphate deaminase
MNAAWPKLPAGTLTDADILRLATDHLLITEGFELKSLKQACYELTSSNIFYDVASTHEDKRVIVNSRIGYLLKPHCYVVAITQECLALPDNVLARILTKGRLFSVGILPVNTYADPGFEGKLGITLYNGSHRYLSIRPGEAIAKIEFNVLPKPAAARKKALWNTELYLSMANDLDAYVATSMRSRKQFREMAKICEKIFSAAVLQPLSLRYFDPTLSATRGHEDKGLMECLMVKCARVLIYTAGDQDSYGKDAEAAMALSQGKPVIFLRDEKGRSRFFREVHPLSRLIDFQTGVAVGAMATSSVDEVALLLGRIFENDMQYRLEQPRKGYYRLIEQLTGSTVRLQTNDTLLRETFFNCYHLPPRA